MYDKPTILFEMLKTAGLLYELRYQGPNKLMYALGRYNRAAFHNPDVFDGEAEINACPYSAEEMAVAFLEHTYNGGACPYWLENIEKMDSHRG